MREKALAVGGLLAALAASSCCVLPLGLGVLGIGGTLVSALGVFAPYETLLRLLATALLGGGFWLVYATRPEGAAGEVCKPTRMIGWAVPVLWAGAALMALVLTAPMWDRFVA